MDEGFSETERALLMLHGNLIEFYKKHKPENTHEDVLTILMQFFIDSGGAALNQKLRAKYGEDLQTFKNAPPLSPSKVDPAANRTSKNLDAMVKRANVQQELGIELPPPTAVETNFNKQDARKSVIKSAKGKKGRRKKANKDPDLIKFKNEASKEIEKNAAEVEELLSPMKKTKHKTDPKLKLNLLDKPANDSDLSPRALIEAFYARYDPAKLESDASIGKFVSWVEAHSVNELSDKLKGKYGEGLFDVKKLALRRRNLESLLRSFYEKHDPPKLESRWTLVKIVTWAMDNGIDELNRKFLNRYGYPVVVEATELEI